MSAIWLGLTTDVLVQIPPPIWPEGSPPTLSVVTTRNVKKYITADGSAQYDILLNHLRSWNLDWDGIVQSDADILEQFRTSVTKLVYLNEFTDNVYHNVVVTEFECDLKAETAARIPRYIAHMKLEEV